MKLLHIFADGPDELPGRIIEAQSREHDVEIIDLSQESVSYGEVIDAIFSCDRLVCW